MTGTAPGSVHALFSQRSRSAADGVTRYLSSRGMQVYACLRYHDSRPALKSSHLTQPVIARLIEKEAYRATDMFNILKSLVMISATTQITDSAAERRLRPPSRVRPVFLTPESILAFVHPNKAHHRAAWSEGLRSFHWDATLYGEGSRPFRSRLCHFRASSLRPSRPALSMLISDFHESSCRPLAVCAKRIYT